MFLSSSEFTPRLRSIAISLTPQSRSMPGLLSKVVCRSAKKPARSRNHLSRQWFRLRGRNKFPIHTNEFFCDDESVRDVKRMTHLADLIREAGIKKNYFLSGRVDTIVNHPDLFA
jgi:hypothetical protein